MHMQDIIVRRPSLSHTQVHYPPVMNSMNTYLIFSDICARRGQDVKWISGTSSELFLIVLFLFNVVHCLI